MSVLKPELELKCNHVFKATKQTNKTKQNKKPCFPGLTNPDFAFWEILFLFFFLFVLNFTKIMCHFLVKIF